MLFAFIGLVAAFLASRITQDDMNNKYMKYFIFMVSAILILYDTYTYVILPEQISQFYGTGGGIAYGNTTAFGSSDVRVAYLMSHTNNDWVNISTLFSIAMYLVPVVMLMLGIKWATEHNTSGGSLDKGKVS